MSSQRKDTRLMLHFVRSIAAWSAICLLTLSLSGCPVGAIYALIVRPSPTVTVAAKYELPAGRLLILVNSPPERIGLCGVRPMLSRELAGEIEVQSLAPSVIPPEELAMLRFSIENFGQLGIAEIGQHLSAQQVLHVDVIEFSLGDLMDRFPGQGLARARVKVVDVEQKQRVWPETKPLGHEVIVRTDFRDPSGKDYRQDLAEDLCKRTAVAIIKLFREHEEARPSGLQKPAKDSYGD